MTGMTAHPAPVLDPHADIVDLTAAIVDIESVSGNEQALADAVEHGVQVISTSS
jgi:succinyl-diaminopimelate desuccinylase